MEFATNIGRFPSILHVTAFPPNQYFFFPDINSHILCVPSLVEIARVVQEHIRMLEHIRRYTHPHHFYILYRLYMYLNCIICIKFEYLHTRKFNLKYLNHPVYYVYYVYTYIYAAHNM